MSCGIVIVKQGCANIIKVESPARNVCQIQPATRNKFEIRLSNIGPKGIQGADGISWQWGNAIVDVPINIVYSNLFRNQLAPIIFIDGAPFKWAKLGVIQNKKDQPGEEGQTPYLDFSRYEIGDRMISGEIDFQYIITS